MRKIWAEGVNYWQTSRTGPDAWLEKAKREIIRAGGKVVGNAMVEMSGRAGFMLAFEIGPDRFKVEWPVLQPKKGNIRAAKIQSATALYHEVKAACVKAKFLGSRSAFLAYLVLPDGRAASEVSGPEILEMLPPLLLIGD